MISHLHEHLFDVGKAKLADVVVPERVELPRGNLIALDQFCLGMEGAHVFNKTAGHRGRQFDGLAGYGVNVGIERSPDHGQFGSPGTQF